uniref:endonuclease/exonuclease/phosphatase family protein n=1 Tax=Clostridium sp. TaxID=1506 RepID=UPI00359FEC2F
MGFLFSFYMLFQSNNSNWNNRYKDYIEKIHDIKPDVIAIQETKLRATGPTKKHQEILAQKFPEYDYVWRSSEEPARKGYAGTMYLYKKELKPKASYPKIGAPEPMDSEGRIITLEFPKCFVTQVYTPNSGNGLSLLRSIDCIFPLYYFSTKAISEWLEN